MKKTLLSVAMVVAVCAAMMSVVGCASKDIKGKGIEIVVGPSETVDWQGRASGGNIPGWPNMSKAELTSALGLKDKEVWRGEGKGKDLDLLRIRTDQEKKADAVSEIRQAMGGAAEAGVNAVEGASDTEKKQIAGELLGNIAALEIYGLKKEADFWILERQPTEAGAYDYYYTYYVVFSMDKALYKQQLEKAINNGMEDNPITERIRSYVMDKLLEQETD